MAKILIVEDEADIRELLRFNLEREGFTVHEAADGTQGGGPGDDREAFEAFAEGAVNELHRAVGDGETGDDQRHLGGRGAELPGQPGQHRVAHAERRRARKGGEGQQEQQLAGVGGG